MQSFEHGFPELALAQPDAPPSGESEAALRQLTLQRLMGYGVEYGDATRIRTALERRVPWKEGCLAIAESVLANGSLDGIAPSDTTRSTRGLRASAMLRMAQMMMLHDSPERTALYRRAAGLFEAAQGAACEKRLVAVDGGRLVGWLMRPPGGRTDRVVIVLGGIEGWAMDFEFSARALVQRGLAVFVLDGPGQGESRFEHGVFLTPGWKSQLAAVVDHLEAADGASRVGILGNSMGGNFAMQFAAAEPRIAACGNNGGMRYPLTQRSRSNFYPKVEAFCDRAAGVQPDAMWATMEMTPERTAIRCPFLIVHGESDPLVSLDDSQAILGWAPSSDKRMHVFARGDHCIYDKPADRMDLTGDWFAGRL